MQYRDLGRTGWKVSACSFGAWAIGADWGAVDDTESLAALNRAIELGVNFIDTADVYGDGRSERLMAKLRRQHRERIYIATKAGRRLNPHNAAGYNRANLISFVERSLKNLEMDALDLLQLHCPPYQIYYMPEVFGVLDDLVTAGKIRYYGVSVEKVEEALKASNIQTYRVANIFNMFVAELFFEQAEEDWHPARYLSSGLLTGGNQFTIYSDDHRAYNRHGESFDRGETFSGVDYATGLQAVEELKDICPRDMSMTQFALRWILMFDAVSCAIPGAKRPSQVDENFTSSDLPPISAEKMNQVRSVYDRYIRQLVHHYW
jgi:aryl-alcohol dehydrogenase-like predicted oxidoreductase